MKAVRSAILWLGSVLLLLALVVGSTAEPAAAQGGKSVDSKKLDVIRERMEKGQALFASGDAAGAAKVFEAGYAELPYAAFLFNAGVCYQKVGDVDRALEKFRAYLKADPGAPDADKVKNRIAALEAAKGIPPTPSVADAGPDDAAPTADDAGEGGAPVTPAPVVPVLGTDTAASMKSLALIETDPQGAPLELYQRLTESAAPFQLGGDNPGWKQVAVARSPANLTLDVGRYHVVVKPYLDFRSCDTDIQVERAKVFHFRANLSQGAFMSFLRVSANVQGAYVFLDDKERKRAPWGTTPHGELVSSGAHSILVEAPGFETFFKPVDLGHGEQKELEVKLVRVLWGFLSIDATAPEVKVRVDEKPVGVWRAGEAPLRVKLDSGSHRLTIEGSGYKTYDAMVTVPRGQVLPIRANMVEKYPRGAAWTQAIIGAVFLGAGVYLGLESNSLHQELEADRKAGVLEEEDSRIKKGRLFAIGADIGFAIGGVLAAFATYNFIKDPRPDSSSVEGKPFEPEDPRKARPTAQRSRPRYARRKPSSERPGFAFGPTLAPNGAGFGIGGSF